jgi:hypothetical protein
VSEARGRLTLRIVEWLQSFRGEQFDFTPDPNIVQSVCAYAQVPVSFFTNFILAARAGHNVF